MRISWPAAAAWLVRTTPRPWPRRTTSPLTYPTWGSIRRLVSWMRTPWPAAVGCSARTIPILWPRRATSPLTYGSWGSQAARELDEDTVARYRRVLGEDHPDAFGSADLAADLRALGEYQAARRLDEDILGRRRRVLGEDHPDTLTSVSNLAADVHALEEISDGPRAGQGQ